MAYLFGCRSGFSWATMSGVHPFWSVRCRDSGNANNKRPITPSLTAKCEELHVIWMGKFPILSRTRDPSGKAAMRLAITASDAPRLHTTWSGKYPYFAPVSCAASGKEWSSVVIASSDVRFTWHAQCKGKRQPASWNCAASENTPNSRDIISGDALALQVMCNGNVQWQKSNLYHVEVWTKNEKLRLMYPKK